jgi:hypothetical protein
MTGIRDTDREMRIDPDSFSGGYFRNAVYRHSDPYEDVPEELLEGDRERIVDSEMTFERFGAFRASVAKFGAGEEAVTEDLAPLIEYAQEKLSRRIEIITDADAELPPVEELVKIEGADRSGAAGDD